MNIALPSDLPPIYGQLVLELGDVVAETRNLAEKVQAQARETLNFTAAHRIHPDGEGNGSSDVGRTGQLAVRPTED